MRRRLLSAYLSSSIPKQAGAGALGAILLGVVAGAFVLVIGRTMFLLVRSPILRVAVALVFAIPATVAGYSTTSVLFGLAGATEGWCVAFGIIGAIAVGATAWQRLAAIPPSMAVGDQCRPMPSWAGHVAPDIGHMPWTSPTLALGSSNLC